MLQHRQSNYSLGEIAALRELFLSLSKEIKASRQYPPQHPIPTQFKAALFEKLGSFFELSDLLAVKVHYDSFTAEDEVVYHAVAGPDNIAHRLHRDGVRYLEISRHVTPHEAATFFEAFVICSNRDEACEDIVNLFWRADFEHIRYDAVDVFEVGDVKESYLGRSKETSSSYLDSQNSPPYETAISWTTPEDDSLPSPHQTDTIDQEITDNLDDIVAFSTGEISTIEEMLQEDRKLAIKEQVVELLLQLCQAEDVLPDLTLVVESLQLAFDKAIQDGDFRATTTILQKVKQLLASDQFSSPMAKKKLSEFVARCGDKIRIKMITEVLNRGEEIELEPVRAYLNELGWESLNHLLWMLGELAIYPSRKMVCDLLVDKGLDKIDLLGGAVFDSRWYLVRNVVWVLGETGSSRVLGFLRKVSGHPDVRVRVEVVKALAKIEDDGVVDVQLAMMQDQSEKVRSMTAFEIARGKRQGAFADLRKMVMSKSFADTPLSEMRQIMETMVACGEVAAVDAVQEIVNRSTLFDKGRLRRLQEVAINALQQSNADEALTFLNRLASDPKSRFGQITRKVIAQLQHQRETKANAESR